MALERKRPWQLVVVACFFIISGIWAIYTQVALLRAGQSHYRFDVLFLPLGFGLLLRWRLCRRFAQLALVIGYAIGVIAFLGVPFGITHIEYVTGLGPEWLQLLVILLLIVGMTLLIHWMFHVTRRPDVQSWFERTNEQAG